MILHRTRSLFTFFVVLSLALAMSGLISLSATSLHARAPRPAPSTVHATSAFTPDKGKFRILVGGQEQGKEEFEISSTGGNWIAHGSSEIQTPQGTTHVTGTLTIQPDGTPVRYEWSTQGAKKASASVVFTGATASSELHIEGARPFTQQFTFPSPRVVVLDNNLYHQYTVLARLYDWQQKGVQTFSVLVPQDLTPGSVTVESLGKQDIDGAKLEELRVKTEDLELDLYLDAQRLMRIVVPSSNAEIIRE